VGKWRPSSNWFPFNKSFPKGESK